MPRRLLPLSLLLLAPAALAADIELDRPLGGWRNSQGEAVQYTQAVRYPAVAVSVQEGQAKSGLIAGRIKQRVANAPKRGQPATLIVNGVALPQRIEEDGHFARPYLFGPGSNNVELRAPDGGSKRVQFHDTHAGRNTPRLRVVLAWNTDATDLDLHVITPDGGHAFYGNRVLENGGALDVDVTTGYGPEIFSSPSPQPGAYLVYVNYYGAGENQDDLTVARVTVVNNENTPSEKKQFITVPLRRSGDVTFIGEFHYP